MICRKMRIMMISLKQFMFDKKIKKGLKDSEENNYYTHAEAKALL